MSEGTRTTCPYCGVGCGVIARPRADGTAEIKGDTEHPANFGRLCSKGSALGETLSLDDRLLAPSVDGERASWDQAFNLVAERFSATIAEHGPDSVAFYVSGQILTEDYYVANKLMKGFIGSANIDTNSRLCMASSVAGHRRAFGADTVPGAYEDIELADLVVLVGSNLAWCHPVIYQRLAAAKVKRGTKVTVIDPRATATCEIADMHLAIAPGADVALYSGLLRHLKRAMRLDMGFIAEHTNGFDAALKEATRLDIDAVAALTDLPRASLEAFYELFGATEHVVTIYSQGVNQSSAGTDKVNAILNCHLATGRIGKPGTGPFSITGQPNAMGGREVGGLANLLSAHRDLADPAHRAEVAALWGVEDVPARPGKTAIEMFEAAADGEIRLLWIACTNPAQSMPDQATVRRALERAEFVVLQEAFATTATAAFADLLLPASAWGEKDGTVTNSERRISRVRPAVPAPGAARDDWRIVVDVARRVEQRLRPGRDSLFPFDDAESVWNEHRETTRGRDLDITGLSYALVERDGPQQWPFPEGATRGQARLYADGRFPTADGRAHFFDAEARPPAEPRDARFPFSLTTGRLRDQWHGMSRTGTLGRLFGHVADPAIELGAQDMARLNLGDGDLVRVASRRGELVLPARRSAGQASAQAFIAMHWGEEVLTGRGASSDAFAGVNALTTPAYCPQARQPELKHCAVRIVRAGLAWRLRAMAWLPQAEALARRERLRPLLAQFGYAACVPFGREPDTQGRLGLWLDVADIQAPDERALSGLRTELALSADAMLDYRDPRTGMQRGLLVARDAEGAERLQGFWICGTDAADNAVSQWWRETLQADAALEMPARRMLAPGARERGGGAAAAPASPQLCTCFNVSVAQAEAALATASGDAAQRIAQTQGQLRCGTNCGSCLPHLRRLAQEQITLANPVILRAVAGSMAAS